MRTTLIKVLVTAILFVTINGAAYASADVGGISLGMTRDEALQVIKSDHQKNYGRVTTIHFTLTVDPVQRKSGVFDIYTVNWRNAATAGSLTFGVSPLTGRVWSISKAETTQGARPSLQSIVDAAKKYGNVNPHAMTNAEYVQRWMFDPKGKEMEWANSYDKIQNGGCFSKLEAAGVPGASMMFPDQPTGTCASVYWVNAQSSQHDGLASSFVSSAIDITAFPAWFESINANKQKQTEQEKNNAAKPQL